MKKKIPLTIALKRRKYLEIKVTKEVKDLYTENYKTLMKDIEEDTDNMERHPMFMVTIFRMYILP